MTLLCIIMNHFSSRYSRLVTP